MVGEKKRREGASPSCGNEPAQSTAVYYAEALAKERRIVAILEFASDIFIVSRPGRADGKTIS